MAWGKPGSNGKGERFESAQVDDTSIGNILVKMEFITAEQLDRAVEIQRQQAPHIGEILIQMGALTEEKLESALLKQKLDRGVASPREESEFYRLHRRQVITEVSIKIKETSAVSNALAAKLGKAKIPSRR